jgi:S1-C subfamily serine protease
MSVLDGSAAARGGVQVDDLILSVDDQLVGDAPTFGAVIATRTGDTILKVLRGSQTIQLTVHLEPR